MTGAVFAKQVTDGDWTVFAILGGLLVTALALWAAMRAVEGREAT